MASRSDGDLILASASPRRKLIMGLLGVPFRVVAADVPEQNLPGEKLVETATRLALAKAQAVAKRVAAGIVIGADTIVVLEGAIMGKPADATEATAMLRALRGRRHDVTTGVAVLDIAGGRQEVTATTSAVWMRHYSDAEIADYVASGEPLDKAGGYAVQSESFHPAEKIRGCYLNVVGLPLCVVVASLCALGYPVPALRPDQLPECSRTCKSGALLVNGCT